jgi:hypothetical protein
MKRTFRSLYKRRLVIFMKHYRLAKEKAKNLMSTGDINVYLKELVETEKKRQKAAELLKSM